MDAAIALWLGAQVADVIYTTLCIAGGTCYEINPVQHLVGWPLFAIFKLAVIVGLPFAFAEFYKRDRVIGLLTAWTAAIGATAPMWLVAYQLLVQ